MSEETAPSADNFSEVDPKPLEGTPREWLRDVGWTTILQHFGDDKKALFDWVMAKLMTSTDEILHIRGQYGLMNVAEGEVPKSMGWLFNEPFRQFGSLTGLDREFKRNERLRAMAPERVDPLITGMKRVVQVVYYTRWYDLPNRKDNNDEPQAG